MAIFAGSPLGVAKKLRFFSSKLWHVAYQIAGICDGEFKHGTHFVENQNFEKILDHKFGPKLKKGLWQINFFSNYGMWHIKLQILLMGNSNMEPILWKIKILKILDQKFKKS